MSSDRAKEAVTLIIQTMKTSQMYPQDHPRVQEKISDTEDVLGDIFDREDQLVLGVDGGQLLIQESPADQSDEFLKQFKQLIEERNLGSLVLQNGLTRNELLDLIWILRNGPEEVLEGDELRDDLISSFDHVKFNTVSVQISENDIEHSENGSEDEESEDEDEGSGASPYAVLAEQLEEVLDEVDTDEVLSDLPDDLKEKMKSSFTKLGFNVLTNVLNQLVEHAEHAGEKLSGESTQKIFNRMLLNMTEEKDVSFSEFKKGMKETLDGMGGNLRENLIDVEEQPGDESDSARLLSRLTPEVRGNVIGNELREGDDDKIREAVEELSSSGDDLLSISKSVAENMDVDTDRDVSGLSQYFDTLFEDVSFPDKQGRVAFVDDNEAFREQYGTILKKMGFEVEEFERGQDAREAINQEDGAEEFDLLVLDLELPEKDGLDLLKDIGTMRIDLPVIVATEESEFQNSFEVLTYPELEFLEKPVNPEGFIESVARHFRGPASQTIEEQEIEAEERQEAREIQEKLINQDFPDFDSFQVESYYEPSKYVGGDFLDYLPLSKSRSLFLIGDVSGRGVPAAMVMVMVRSVLRMCFGQMSSPERALKRANQLITRDMREGMYVSLALCVIDTDENTMTVLNAGQRTPIMWRDEEKQSELLLSDGIAIGLSDQNTFASSLNSKTLDVDPRDTVVFYTEGISEALNEVDERFGVSRLLEITSEHGGSHPENLTKEIVKGVKQFQGDAPQQKDTTLLAVQFDPS